MEYEYIEKLRLLKYQKEFCKPNNFKPLTPTYFLLPTSSPNEQFFYFTSLFAWLMKLCGVAFDVPGQFDDPNATVANIISTLKSVGIAFDHPPAKLKAGSGEVVIHVLESVLSKTLETLGFRFEKPQHLPDDYSEEAEVDEAAEVTTDAVEESIKEEEGDTGEEVFVDIQQAATTKETAASESNSQNNEPKVDPAVWKLEVERVTPKLKVVIANDNKDWRVHLDQMKMHDDTINKSLGSTKTQLEKLTAEIEKNIEKISSREKYINGQFQNLIEEYRTTQEQVSELREKYNSSNGKVTELTNELARVSEDLENIKSQMDELGTGMTDPKPLVNIKQGLTRLKSEIKQMDLRIGVVQHTLLNAKIKNKASLAADIARMSSNAQAFAVHIH